MVSGVCTRLLPSFAGCLDPWQETWLNLVLIDLDQAVGVLLGAPELSENPLSSLLLRYAESPGLNS